MRHATLLVAPFAVLLLLAGCGRLESRAAPVTTNPAGSAASMPQPMNSLPLGSAVGSPLTR